ncbi:unnamed protein product [Aureobasidium mustum]|uniref:BTB domain-containing protein n=1 Tax=Aureobasidium mustum TaxID=2773714 RepID=A0A9N8PM23_9PEZI|nr:unnamed protein product [Aureobasidium mustum]
MKSPETIKLASTKDGVVVSIHKGLLCFFSSYYAAALNGNFLEAEKDRFEVGLSGAQLQAFAEWIYTGTFNVHDREDEFLFISLYIFADLVDIIALRRSAISHIADLSIVSWSMVELILKNVTQNSPLRRHVSDNYIAHWMPTTDANRPRLPDSQTDSVYLVAHSNFMFELLKGVALRKVSADDATKCPCCNDLCKYHEHESDEEREASMLMRMIQLVATY